MINRDVAKNQYLLSDIIPLKFTHNILVAVEGDTDATPARKAYSADTEFIGLSTLAIIYGLFGFAISTETGLNSMVQVLSILTIFRVASIALVRDKFLQPFLESQIVKD